MRADAGNPDPALVLVTGAAGAIGSATVAAFLNVGFRVAGLDRDPSVLMSRSERYVGYQVNLEETSRLADVVGSACDRGDLSHVIGIAGGALSEEALNRDIAELDPALFRASVEANLVTQFLVVRSVLPWLRRGAKRNRSIALTSSFNALSGWGMPAYSAAKAGLIGLVYALTGPLGNDGIRINAVAPGTIQTERTRRIWAQEAGHFERLEAGTATGRLGTPEDVANTFLSLATMLTHVTGQVLVVDGGQSTKR